MLLKYQFKKKDAPYFRELVVLSILDDYRVETENLSSNDRQEIFKRMIVRPRGADLKLPYWKFEENIPSETFVIVEQDPIKDNEVEKHINPDKSNDKSRYWVLISGTMSDSSIEDLCKRILLNHTDEIDVPNNQYLGGIPQIPFVKKLIEKFHIIIYGRDFVNWLVRKHKAIVWRYAYSVCPNALFETLDDGLFKANVLMPDIGTEVTTSLNDQKELVEQYLSLVLRQGPDVALFVGNGTSRAFGSDDWSKMSDSLANLLVPEYANDIGNVRKKIGDSNYNVAEIVSDNLGKERYASGIRSSVYRKYDVSMHKENTLVRSIAKAKAAHENLAVLTYNFDNFLEEDLKRIGLQVNVEYKSNSRMPEPKIVHVHGFLPPEGDGHDIVLSRPEYEKYYKTKKEWVWKTQADMLKSRVCIFVGSSMSDVYQMKVIEETLRLSERRFPRRCFAIIAFKCFSKKDRMMVESYFYGRNVEIIPVCDHEAIPKELDKIMSWMP